MPPLVGERYEDELRPEATTGVGHATAGIGGGDGVDRFRGGGEADSGGSGGGDGGGGGGGGRAGRRGVVGGTSSPPSCLGWSSVSPAAPLHDDEEEDGEEDGGTLYVTTSSNSRCTNTGVSRVRCRAPFLLLLLHGCIDGLPRRRPWRDEVPGREGGGYS